METNEFLPMVDKPIDYFVRIRKVSEFKYEFVPDILNAIVYSIQHDKGITLLNVTVIIWLYLIQFQKFSLVVAFRNKC